MGWYLQYFFAPHEAKEQNPRIKRFLLPMLIYLSTLALARFDIGDCLETVEALYSHFTNEYTGGQEFMGSNVQCQFCS